MAHGKETPRQKMIGMMYLVLTAMLALNVSVSVLDAFKIIDEGLEKTGIKIDVRRLRDEEITRTLYQYPRKYNLVIVAMDAIRPDHEVFFEYLVRADGYFDHPIPRIREQFRLLTAEEDIQKKGELARELAHTASKEYLVLPLLQVRRRYYYPADIKNLTVGKGFLEYPEIADFRW